jgi:hypothetical protein
VVALLLLLLVLVVVVEVLAGVSCDESRADMIRRQQDRWTYPREVVSNRSMMTSGPRPITAATRANRGAAVLLHTVKVLQRQNPPATTTVRSTVVPRAGRLEDGRFFGDFGGWWWAGGWSYFEIRALRKTTAPPFGDSGWVESAPQPAKATLPQSNWIIR